MWTRWVDLCNCVLYSNAVENSAVWLVAVDTRGCGSKACLDLCATNILRSLGLISVPVKPVIKHNIINHILSLHCSQHSLYGSGCSRRWETDRLQTRTENRYKYDRQKLKSQVTVKLWNWCRCVDKMLLQENYLAINQRQTLYFTININNNSYLSASFHYAPKTFD